jgi:hypothetical protein
MLISCQSPPHPNPPPPRGRGFIAHPDPPPPRGRGFIAHPNPPPPRGRGFIAHPNRELIGTFAIGSVNIHFKITKYIGKIYVIFGNADWHWVEKSSPPPGRNTFYLTFS